MRIFLLLQLFFIALAVSICPFAGMKFYNGTNVKLPVGHHAPHLLREGDPNASTLQGCQCATACGATVDDGFKCDWCKTKDNCGPYSIPYLSHYDYCTYPANATYEAQTWQAKLNYLKQQVSADKSTDGYPNVAGIFAEGVQTSFDTFWDHMPMNRKKYIHGTGVVCEMDMTIDSGAYTGIFEKGTQTGLLRMGSALDISLGTMVPGNGYKFPRTGRLSANWVTLYTLAGIEGGDFNFFARNQSNHVPPPEGVAIPLAYKFQQASNCVLMVGLSDAAKYTQDGAEIADENVRFPYRLTFAPTPDAEHLISSFKMSLDLFLSEMEGIPSQNFPLWNIYAAATPEEDEVDAAKKIGTISITNKCTRSQFGDKNLFFKHQRIEDDLLFPQAAGWRDNLESQEKCFNNEVPENPPDRCMDGKVFEHEN